MSEPAAVLSLADKARRLAALARAKRETESESQDQVRLVNQLTKLSAELVALKTALAVHGRLVAHGVPVADLPDLASEPSALRDQVGRIGRPNWQYISARVASVSKTHAAIAETDTTAWRTWAQDRVAMLPLALIPRLADRSVAERHVATLRRLAAASPTVGTLIEFRTSFERVRDELERVQGAGVDAVLARFSRGRILLADLSDEELELLRSEDVLRDQLYVYLS